MGRHSVLTTHHRTPNTVSISTMHSNPCYAMFSCMYNAIHTMLFIPCYIYNENYMCIHTHAYLSMHHLDIHIKVHTNSKLNILIQAYMDITSHYHPGNDTHQSLGLVMTKDQNIGKHGYIGNWILRKYRKYR